MMLLPKVRRSTMAAQRRGSVNVFVQPEKDSFEAIATLFFSLDFGSTPAPSSCSARPGSRIKNRGVLETQQHHSSAAEGVPVAELQTFLQLANKAN